MKTIVVGVDHSERSDHAIRRANRIALAIQAQLVLVFSLDIGKASRLRPLLERVAEEETLENVRGLLGNEHAPLAIEVGVGRPFEVLRNVAVKHQAYLIVVGAHRVDPGVGRTGGVTATRLVNVTPAPVLVATNASEDTYEDVLVGYDDSEPSKQALRFARGLAPKARLTALTACLIPFSARRVAPELVQQFEQDGLRMAKEALAAEFGSELGHVQSMARAGVAHGVILDVVAERKPDLLVLGTSMPEIYRRIFGGGIVDLVLADPPCDLLVVKS